MLCLASQIRSNPGLETEDIVFRVGSIALGSVTLPASLTQNLTADQQQLASRVQFNFFQKSTFFQVWAHLLIQSNAFDSNEFAYY